MCYTIAVVITNMHAGIHISYRYPFKQSEELSIDDEADRAVWVDFYVINNCFINFASGFTFDEEILLRSMIV